MSALLHPAMNSPSLVVCLRRTRILLLFENRMLIWRQRVNGAPRGTQYYSVGDRKRPVENKTECRQRHGGANISCGVVAPCIEMHKHAHSKQDHGHGRARKGALLRFPALCNTHHRPPRIQSPSRRHHRRCGRRAGRWGRAEKRGQPGQNKRQNTRVIYSRQNNFPREPLCWRAA